MNFLTSQSTSKSHWKSLICIALLVGMSSCAFGLQKALNQRQIIGLVEGGVASQRVAHLVEERGVDFEATPDFVAALKQDGAGKVLLDALRAANLDISPQAEQFAEKGRKAQKYLRESKDLLQHRQWREAESSLRRSLQLDPTNPEAHFYLGYTLSKEKKWNDAIAEYRQAVFLAPDSGPARCNLGNALVTRHQWKKAAEQYQQAIQLNPGDEKAHYGLGLTRYHQQNWSGAEGEFREALSLHPADTRTLCALGLALLRQNKLNQALRAYQQAVKLSPHSALAHAGLAYVLLDRGEKQQALREFKTAASLAPHDLRYRVSYDKLWEELKQ
ncbi:MAG: tetratricopeptide repeat protein [Terriglobia bacterium]